MNPATMDRRHAFPSRACSIARSLALWVVLTAALAAPAAALDLRAVSLTPYPSASAASMTLEFEVAGDPGVPTATSFWIGDGGSSEWGDLVVDGTAWIYRRIDFTTFGPKTISAYVDKAGEVGETNEGNNAMVLNVCVPGPEILNNGIDEDCNGADTADVVINSPTPQSRTTFTTWDVDVTTTFPAQGCTYEFGQREDQWITPPVYHSVTSTGTLSAVGGTHFTKTAVDPGGDHNYLRVFCLDAGGTVHTAAIHLEIDRVRPGTVTDLQLASTGIETGNFLYVTYTMPGDNGFERYPQASAVDLRWSTAPIITDTDFSAARHFTAAETSCYRVFETNTFDGGSSVKCTLGFPTSSAMGNDSLVVNGVYVAAAFGDSTGRWSRISNTAWHKAPLHECVLETSLKIIRPNLYPSQYQTYYTGDEIEYTVIIRSLGDRTRCMYRVQNVGIWDGGWGSSNPIGNIDQSYSVSPGEPATFKYTWKITTATAEHHAAQLIVSPIAGIPGYPSNVFLNVHGINLNRYMEISDPYNLNTKWYPYGTLPNLLYFDIYNWADTYNTSNAFDNSTIGQASFRWLPVKLHYTKLEPDWQLDIRMDHPFLCLNTTTCPGSIGLPQDFYDYQCPSPYFECHKPFSQYLSTENFIGWKLVDMEPGVSYQVWMTAGVYPDALETSDIITVLYG